MTQHELQPETRPNQGCLTIGAVFHGRYDVLSAIGQGGMGEVYKCVDQQLEQIVAVKVLTSVGARNSSIVRRFLNEAKLLGALTHPNIIRSRNFDVSTDGLPYIVMEYLDGESLHDIFAREGALPPSLVIDFFEQICSALICAHDMGIIHRDLKPSNVIVTGYGGSQPLVKLLDFGIAKLLTPDLVDDQRLTMPGALLGSPLYMSPEQCAGSTTLDARSDIYSLGCMLYQALAGQLPFSPDSLLEAAAMHLSLEPPPIDNCPRLLSKCVAKSLAKCPEARYQNICEVKEALVQAKATTNLKSLVTASRLMNRRVATIAIVSVIAAGVSLCVFNGPSVRESAQKEESSFGDSEMQNLLQIKKAVRVGHAALARHDYNGALDAFHHAQSIHAKDREQIAVQLGLARAYLAQGDIRKAEKAVSSAASRLLVEDFQLHAQVEAMWGRCWLYRRDYKNAELHLYNAMEIVRKQNRAPEDDFSSVLVDLVKLQWRSNNSQGYRHSLSSFGPSFGNLDIQLNYLRQLESAADGNAEAQALIFDSEARLLELQKKDFQSLKAANNALKLRSIPSNKLAEDLYLSWILMAPLCERTGQRERALALYEKGIASMRRLEIEEVFGPESEYAGLLAQHGDTKKAREYFRAALQHASLMSDPNILFGIAQSLTRSFLAAKQDDNTAAESYRELKRIAMSYKDKATRDKFIAQSDIFLGSYEVAKHNWLSAVEHYKQATQTMWPETEAPLLEASKSYSDALLRLGRTAEAEGVLARTLKCYNDRFPTMHNEIAQNIMWIGLVQFAAEKPDDAVDSFSRAINRAPYGSINRAPAFAAKALNIIRGSKFPKERIAAWESKIKASSP